MLPLIALVLLLLAFALPALAGAPAGAVPATLVDVIDGDTIDVLVNDQLERVRYIGVDTPERAQPGYLAATEANRTLLQAGLVTPSPLLYLVKDVSERDKTSDVRFARIFRLFAVQAAQKRLGFWSRTPPQPDGAMSYALTTGPARVRKGSIAPQRPLAKQGAREGKSGCDWLVAIVRRLVHDPDLSAIRPIGRVDRHCPARGGPAWVGKNDLGWQLGGDQVEAAVDGRRQIGERIGWRGRKLCAGEVGRVLRTSRLFGSRLTRKDGVAPPLTRTGARAGNGLHFPHP